MAKSTKTTRKQARKSSPTAVLKPRLPRVKLNLPVLAEQAAPPPSPVAGVQTDDDASVQRTVRQFLDGLDAIVPDNGALPALASRQGSPVTAQVVEEVSFRLRLPRAPRLIFPASH
ncbi:hypothetical protein AURDEDRAFT_171057 [Auricularia subglabra TFB-10046 SS5]|nr:hypothetical protein AURDEDRAFT_171057 [Auricularia subglabra TFB-10046 SS5]